MRNRILTVIGIGLLAAMSSTYADSGRGGVVGNGTNLNGSSLQGVDWNGSSIQGVDWNGSNVQGVDWNGSNVQGVNPNGSNLQGSDPNGSERQSVGRNDTASSRVVAPSTGLKLRGVHVVGGRLLSGDAPSRTPRKD